jgi:glycogen debranching enzyme
MTKGAAPGEPRAPAREEATRGDLLRRDPLPSAGDVEQLVRARGGAFLVTSRSGDIVPAGARELGLFDRDTRFLSHYELCFARGQMVRLSAATAHDAYNQIDLMVSDQDRADVLDDPKNYLHVRRRQMLSGGLVEEIAITNFLTRTIAVDLTILFDADFVDVFEVRGARRARRGVVHPPRVTRGQVVLAYDGLCGTRFTSTVAFHTAPRELRPCAATFSERIAAGDAWTIALTVTPGRDREHRARWPRGRAFPSRAARLERDAAEFRAQSTSFRCDNGRLQRALDQAVNDLHDLCVEVDGGAIVGAGIPWFCAPFGRDALITSYESLLVSPSLAERSLRTLAAFQGKIDDDVTEEEPGKIFHELRFGEMARAREIPHRPYYGSVDATPLFVIVVDALHRVTADRALVRDLAGPVVAALGWIDRQSEGGTRLVRYKKRSARGLDNQGWKDSRAGVSHADGRFAEPPIALAEVQGYCVDAYRRGARLFRALGDEARAGVYAARAEAMRDRVEAALWLERQGRYAFGVDGNDRPITTVVSNVGHLLWSRVPTAARAAATARLLLAPRCFSGFGVRTLAADQAAYNPLSYHNGTVWPHDNALIARGLSSYDLSLECAAIFDGLYAAMGFFPDGRLPELFCGIARGAGPLVRYPVACSPQAWSSASAFLLLQAILGIHVDAPAAKLAIRNPRLPPETGSLELRSLRIGRSTVSIRFRRVGARCQIDRLDVAGAPLRTEIAID